MIFKNNDQNPAVLKTKLKYLTLLNIPWQNWDDKINTSAIALEIYRRKNTWLFYKYREMIW